MSAPRAVTRIPAALYLAMGLPAVVSLQIIPSLFVVAGDAAATARRITENALFYRAGVFCDLVSNIAFLFLALTLYGHFRDVDRRLARLLVALVGVSVAVGLAVEVFQLAPLALLGRAEYLQAFTRPQVEALVMTFVRLRSTGLVVQSALWGLWLLPFGLLVIRSGFLPRALGYCLIAGGLAYSTSCVVGILAPALRAPLTPVLLALYAIGEGPMLLWLLIRGMPLRDGREVRTPLAPVTA